MGLWLEAGAYRRADVITTEKIGAPHEGSLRARMLAPTPQPRNAMTLCPIALVAGCAKCPAVSVCPLKTVIGDAPKPGAKAAPTASKKK